jgi:hypothetical protein
MKSNPPKLLSVTIAIIILTGVTNVFSQSEKSGFKPTVKSFCWLQAGFINDETGGGEPTFEFAHARFGLKGMVHEKIGYHLMIEGIHGGGFDPKVYQAWIDYNFHKYANVRVGQFKYPFGIEAYPGFVWWKFINASYVTGGVVKHLGRHNAGEDGLFRDIGCQLSGKYRPNEEYAFIYKIMVMNGNSVNRTDNNDNKDFVLQGAMETSFGAKFGLSYYSGRYGENFDSLIVVIDTLGDTQDVYMSTFTMAAKDEWAIGFHCSWEHNIGKRDFKLQGEYISGTYDAHPRDVRPWGYYLYGTLFVMPEVEAGIRYDFYEPNRNARDPATDAKVDANRQRMTLAGSYHFSKDQLITVNYEIIDDDVSNRDNLLTILCQITL